MFSLPSLDSLSQGLRQVVPTVIKGARADFWPNNLVIIVKVVALAVYEAMLRARWVYRQIFVSTCTGAHLDVHGAELGLPRANASAADGTATFTPSASLTVPVGTQFVSDSGVFYIAATEATGLTGVAFGVSLVASDPGIVGNAPAGMLVRPVSSLAGLDAPGEFLDGPARGADAEADEPYRARILERLRSRPRGGNADDYLFWVKETGVFNAAAIRGWLPYAGRVTIYPLKPGSGRARIPTELELLALAEHMETRRPLCAEVILAQAADHAIDIAITGLANDNPTVRQEIAAELADMFDERAAVALPGESATFSRSWIAEAISRATGEDRHVLASPASDVALAAGQLPVVGTIGYS